jgi:hypothetical protein
MSFISPGNRPAYAVPVPVLLLPVLPVSVPLLPVLLLPVPVAAGAVVLVRWCWVPVAPRVLAPVVLVPLAPRVLVPVLVPVAPVVWVPPVVLIPLARRCWRHRCWWCWCRPR